VGSVKLFISARVTFRPFMVTQGHWFCSAFSPS